MPNGLLRELLGEAGWTGQAFADQINDLGSEAGLTLRYQRASVTQWLSGIRPRPPVPELAAEALTRRLGRSVTPEKAGLLAADTPRAEPDARSWWTDDVPTRLRELRDSTNTGRETLVGRVYSSAQLVPPGWDVLIAGTFASRLDIGGRGATIGQPEVASAKAMMDLFSAADVTFGGGYARKALATYLDSTIAPWLRAAASPTVHRKLLIVAARLSYLCGFMCFDDELHGTSQRYYLTSIRMSAEAAEPTGYAVTLRAMSVQARLLGHLTQAVHLADAAVRSVSHHMSPQTRAFLFGQLAVAHAAADNHHDAIASLRIAESHLARADDSSQSTGAYHQSALAHQHAAVSAYRGQRQSAITALEASIRHRPAGERRSRAITLARLAELQFTDGHLEQACHTWGLFLDDYPHLRSGRADTAMATLRATTRPHQRSTAARVLLGHAAKLKIA